jgi:hypothetical protein
MPHTRRLSVSNTSAHRRQFQCAFAYRRDEQDATGKWRRNIFANCKNDIERASDRYYCEEINEYYCTDHAKAG